MEIIIILTLIALSIGLDIKIEKNAAKVVIDITTAQNNMEINLHKKLEDIEQQLSALQAQLNKSNP